MLVQATLEDHPGTGSTPACSSVSVNGPLKLDTGLRRYFLDAEAPSFLFSDDVDGEYLGWE